GRKAERRLDVLRVGAHQPVHVVRGEPGVLDRGDARIEGERRRRDLAAIAPEAGGRGAGERDAVLAGIGVTDHTALIANLGSVLASRNTGNGRPSRSTQSSCTGAPITMSSLSAPTTVLVKRKPSCSSSSTVTTG